jgi:hypothetical protein
MLTVGPHHSKVDRLPKQHTPLHALMNPLGNCVPGGQPPDREGGGRNNSSGWRNINADQQRMLIGTAWWQPRLLAGFPLS